MLAVRDALDVCLVFEPEAVTVRLPSGAVTVDEIEPREAVCTVDRDRLAAVRVRLRDLLGFSDKDQVEEAAAEPVPTVAVRVTLAAVLEIDSATVCDPSSTDPVGERVTMRVEDTVKVPTDDDCVSVTSRDHVGCDTVGETGSSKITERLSAAPEHKLVREDISQDI